MGYRYLLANPAKGTEPRELSEELSHIYQGPSPGARSLEGGWCVHVPKQNPISLDKYRKQR